MFVEHKEAGEVTEAPARTLKLSEAIRIGARLKPQCTGRFWFNGKSCALGAAYEGAFGYLPEGAEDAESGTNILTLRSRAAQVKAHRTLEERFPRKLRAIYEKNDSGWTREQIADWLEAQGF